MEKEKKQLGVAFLVVVVAIFMVYGHWIIYIIKKTVLFKGQI